MRAHRIQLRPTKTQIAYFIQACGVARFTYNWALAAWTTQYKAGQKPSGVSLKKQFNGLYKAEFPWAGAVHRDARSQSFANLQTAMQNFFSSRTKYPQFKKKGKCRDSFYVANDKFHVVGKCIKLPRIGKVRMTEKLRLAGKIVAATVSRVAGLWFVSIRVECSPPLKPKTGNAKLGIDLGVKTSVTCSDGTTYQSPKPLKKRLKRLKRLNRSVSRKVLGSKNRSKAVRKLGKLHWQISNVRNDFLHKTTTSIVRKSQAVCIEDLSVNGMLCNHRLARAISEQGFRQFRTLLQYKAEAYGVEVKVADRFFPSSKTCSCCGHIKPVLKLAERTFTCEKCGAALARDLNAAINLMKQLGAASPEVTPVDCLQTQSPCGLGDSVKQEFQSALLCP